MRSRPTSRPPTSTRILGRGDGLTPLGDDVLCGWLAIHRAAGVATAEVDAAVRRHAARTTLLSATLLDCALHGEVLPEFAAYVVALGTPDEPDRAALLAAIGHTSGRRDALRRPARPVRPRLSPRSRMSTPQHVEIRPGAYADSVTLLQVSRTVQGLDGVLAAQVAMATTLNIEVLTEMGFDVPAEATTNDLVVALRLSEPDALAAALAGVDLALSEANRRRPDSAAEVAPPRTTAAALRIAPQAVVVVSVPGPSALVEAMDALDARQRRDDLQRQRARSTRRSPSSAPPPSAACW